MGSIAIGTCGYRGFDPGEGWKDSYESKLQAYADAFEVGELNRTFYELPQVSTAQRWRREAEPGFEFTLKAWQAITHPWRSPTWNAHRDALPEEWTDDVGYLRPTRAVKEAWGRTRERAEALESSVVVLQTPPSFDATDAHESNLRELLGEVDRSDLTLAWEPRGDWPDHPGRIEAVCEDLDLVHVVDLMRDRPLAEHEVAYVRLHGLNEDLHDYEYDYSPDELDDLADRLRDLARDHDRVYCMFNNTAMYENARALASRID